MKIGEAKRGVVWNLLTELLPLLGVTCAAEAFGLMRWGARTGRMTQVLQLPLEEAIKVELTRLAISIILVFAAALFARWVSDGFGFRPPFKACFTLAVFGLAPYFILHMGFCLPALNEWVGPALGALGCVFFLYQGVGAVLQPPQTQGFGLYVLSALVFAMFCLVDHLVLLMMLQGRIPVPV